MTEQLIHNNGSSYIDSNKFYKICTSLIIGGTVALPVHSYSTACLLQLRSKIHEIIVPQKYCTCIVTGHGV